jgi:hypothetical protein
MKTLLNIVAALLILPALLLKVALAILFFLPEIVLHKFRDKPPVWWYYSAKERWWPARKWPRWYWSAVRNTVPWLRIPLLDVRYSRQQPDDVDIESIHLKNANYSKGWRFTRYKWLLAEYEFVRADPDSYNEYRFGWAVEGDKMKITAQVRRKREYGK